MAPVRANDGLVHYLTTAGEFKLLTKPRTCTFIRRLRDVNRDDYMLVRIDPPMTGRSSDPVTNDVTELLLSTRHQGFSLFSARQEPMEVYVTSVVDPKVLSAESFTREQVQLLAWGTVFNTMAEAEARAHEYATDSI